MHNEDISGNFSLSDAVKRLCAGKLVAVPTETVYGLAADSSNEAAVAEIYRTKQRPDFNPLIVHVPDISAAKKLGKFGDLALRCARIYWPGPLTLVLPKSEQCPAVPAVTAGLDTIALRCPAHPLMRQLLQASGLFLAAPSANISGRISPTSAAHVRHGFGADGPPVLDGGPCEAGIESTIIACSGSTYRILRAGPITAEQLATDLGPPQVGSDAQTVTAPGQLQSHYAPEKTLRLDVVRPEESEFHIGFGVIDGDYNLSKTGDLAEAAARIFAALHLADASDRNAIAIAPIPQNYIGAAINDRLARAAWRTGQA